MYMKQQSNSAALSKAQITVFREAGMGGGRGMGKPKGTAKRKGTSGRAKTARGGGGGPMRRTGGLMMG